jgi:DNA-binding CsgD family transcriptional regulator
MTVPRLSARDAEGILRFLSDAQELGGDEPFTPNVLEELGQLVTADWVAYCEQDRIRQHVRLLVGRAGDEYELDEPLVSYWDIAEEHPVCRVHHTGESRALKLSDFVGLRQLKNSHVYAVWFGPCGINRELNVAIPSPPWHTKTFLFDRGPGPDFTERDRLVLDLLQPHLGRLWRAAQTRRRLRTALAALGREDEHAARGVVCVTPGGEVELCSPAAHRLLREYFGTSQEGQLPIELVDWLQTAAPTLRRAGARHRLMIERVGELLLLEETRDELGLTRREQQIVAWVARGKTNAQIAELLWISPTTVRKHLENVYAKLGVRTRTAAAARFLGTLDEIEEDGTA